jgi:hypothetical protein
METTEFILRQTEIRYDRDVFEHVCNCWRYPFSGLSEKFKRRCREQSTVCQNQIISFCIRFTQNEENICPQELRYEMERSSERDKPNRSQREKFWMNYAVVDPLPYLFFLQFKTYGHLQRHQDQRRALGNFKRVVFTGKNFGHRETALNLLGQCMEQEKKPKEALFYYILSLRQRAKHNVGNVHICNLLSKYAS